MTNLPVADDALAAKHRLDQTRWWEQAACAGAPFDLFDSQSRSGVPTCADRERAAAARVICARCLVTAECREDADLLPDPSFRAGYTAAERARQNR